MVRLKESRMIIPLYLNISRLRGANLNRKNFLYLDTKEVCWIGCCPNKRSLKKYERKKGNMKW